MVSLRIGLVCLSLVVAIVWAAEPQKKPANNRNAPANHNLLTRSKSKGDCYKWCDEHGDGGAWPGAPGGGWDGGDNHKGGSGSGGHKGGHKGSSGSSSSSSDSSSDSDDDDDRKAHAQKRTAARVGARKAEVTQRVAVNGTAATLNRAASNATKVEARKRINARAKVQHPVAHQERKVQTAHQERKAPQKH